MNKCILAVCALAAATGAAQAADVCNSEIEKTKNDWQSIKLEPGSKPSTIEKGVYPHEHIKAAVDTMRYHLAMALCKEGKDHESLLHLDVIRAFLNLPEIRHPTSHHYLFKP